MFGKREWEYLVVFLKLENSIAECQDQLSGYGQDGWELVSTQVNTQAELAFFKRPAW